MISQLTAAKAAANAGNINQVYNGGSMFQDVHIFRDVVTMEGTETLSSYVDFPALNLAGCRLMPETIKMRFVGGAGINVTGKFQRVTAAGVATDITTAAAINSSNATPVGVTAANSADLAPFAVGEFLRLQLTAVTTFTAGKQLVVEGMIERITGPAITG